MESPPGFSHNWAALTAFVQTGSSETSFGLFLWFSSFSLEFLELNTCPDLCPLMRIFNVSTLIDGDLVSETSVLLKGKSRYLFFSSKAILNVVLFQ